MKPTLRLLLPASAALLACSLLWQRPEGEISPPAVPAVAAADQPPLVAESPVPSTLQPAGTPPPTADGSSPGWPFALAAEAARKRVPTASDALPTRDAGRVLALAPDFLDRMADPAGKRTRFPLPGGRTASGTVERLETDEAGVLLIQGRLESPSAGEFFFQRQTAPGLAGALIGNVRLDSSLQAWRVDPTGPDGSPELNEVTLDQVLCVGKPLPPGGTESEATLPGGPETAATALPGTPQQAPQTHPTNMQIPAAQNGVVPLQSLPGAAGVIYLDFDGEPGPFSGWGSVTGDAAPSGASTTQIKEVWQRVAEDFQPFNLNVTTDRGVFDRAAENSRQHVVISPTKQAAPDAGGVAYIGSFNWTGNTVCWSFILTGKSAAEAISHEVGHTLGLGHDGRTSPEEGYFGGHGSGDTAWAPIMGVGYSRNLSQWSKGEYTNANNTEDDLAIITGNNNTVAYRTDDTTAVYATAAYLDILANSSVSNEGIIETRADVDAWRFQSTGGTATLTVSPVNAGPNVDLLAQIYNSANTLIASNNPADGLGATVTATLAAGDYTLQVSGVGKGSVSGDGYSDYGSLGAYLISGSVTNGVKHDRFALNENSPNGTAVGTVPARLAHGANPISFSIASGNTGGAFAINAATGAITVANSAALNYEALSTRWDDPAVIELFVAVTDSVNPALNESLRTVITVNPVNEAPVVTGGAVTMFTRTQTGTAVFAVTGSDPDRFDFPLYSILSGNTGGIFAIDPGSGQITTTAAFAEAGTAGSYPLVIRATDRGSPALTANATVTVTILASPAGYTAGGWMRTYFDGINGEAVSSLTSNSRFPNTPDSEEFHTTADSGIHGNNYGSTGRGYLIPPVTGSYTFWIASDDGGDLRLSPNATPGSATVRASASGATGRYRYDRYSSQQSAAITLTAGQPYYIEARHKEGGGDDYLTVAWQGPGFSRRILSGLYLAPFRQNYAPRIAAQALTVRRGSDLGTPIGTVTATDVNAGDTLASYTITGGTAAAWCAIDANTGLIYISSSAGLNAATAASYTLNVRVADNAVPSLTGTGTVTLNMTAAAEVRAAGIVQQFWDGLSGNNVSTLTSNTRYPNAPSSTRVLTSFDSGGDFSDNYGSRIRAWVVPPVTGSYNFYIASDDESQLRFTTGTNYTTAPQVANLTGATSRENWTANTSQKSAAFSLAAGQRYYIEVRHKEGGGGDFVQVGWTGPGITTPTVIPGSALQPYDINTAPVWTSANYNLTAREGSPAGTPVGMVAASDVDGTQRVYTITGGNTGNAFALNPFSGALTVANRAALVPGTVFSLALRVQDDGVGGIYPYKTAAATATVTVQRDLVLVRPVARSVNLPAGQGLELETLPSGRAGAVMAWTKVSGPGTVTFDNPAAWSTGAAFSSPGFYALRGTETAGSSPLVIDLMVQSGTTPALPGGDRIGTQTATPSHTWDAGTWQISAGGSGLPAAAADGFYFISQPAGTTSTITARITAVQNVSGANSMAGVMIRESADPGARSIFCGVNPLNGRRLILRTTAGLPALVAGAENPATTPFAPCWVRLIRSGNVFTAQTAPDVSGSPGAFTNLGSPQTFPMAGSCFVGLATTSGVSGTRSTATVDNLTITPSLANLAPVLSASAAASVTLPAAAPLTGSSSDDALPSQPGSVTLLWKKAAGPGLVTFSTPATGNTSATFSAEGNYQLRLTADDGEVRTFREVAVSASAAGYIAWAQTEFGVAATNPLIAGETADPDADGLPNLVEYGLGRNPKIPDTGAIVFSTVEIGGQSYLRLSLTRNPAAVVTLTMETTPTPALPGSWGTAGLVIETSTPEGLTARTVQPINALPSQFLRVRATR